MVGDIETPDDPGAVDTLLDTVSDRVRRGVIRYLEQRADETVPFPELVAALADRVPSTDTHQLRLSLAQVHLPKLAARGWLSYDPDQGVVRYYGKENAKRHLEHVCELF